MQIRTKTLFQNATISALGDITIACTIHHSAGVSNRPMRVLGSYALVYLVNGNGFYMDSRRNRKEMTSGDLILLFPELAHAYGPGQGGYWDEMYLVFEGPVFDLWRKCGVFTSAGPVYHLEPVDYWLQRFEEIVTPGLTPLERICRLQTVLADVFTNYERDPAARRDEAWLTKAHALLNVDIGKELYVNDVALRMGLSPETFRKKFVRLAGVPPWHYRMTRVIEHACRLVHEGSLTNKEIAGKLGFNDEFHFSRRFKQITGRSPTQFRALTARH